MHAWGSALLSSPASAMNFTPGYSRHSASTWSSAETTSGSTPTTPSTSACSAIRRSRSPSTGTTRRFRAGPCGRTCRAFHNLTAFVVMSSVAARFFPPQVAGAGATVGQSGYPFRIDHDERFNETTHLQYQFPSSFVPGSGSTGATTAVWSQVRYRATT